MVVRLILVVLLALIGYGVSAQEVRAAPQWRLVADVPLPGRTARFDYQSFDATTGRLWIAHMGADEVLAFDVRTRQVVARVAGMRGATGIRVVPALERVFVALAGSREVAFLDSRDGRVLARVPGGRFPDGLTYAPGAGRLFVSDENGRRELVIDVPSATARRPIDTRGEVGNTQYDSLTGRIWAAVQTRDELVAIDPLADSVIDRVPVPGIHRPHGFCLDPVHRLAYVTGQEGARLGVLDLRTRKVEHTYPTGEEPDVLALDPAHGRLYVASEAGVISAFETVADSLVPIGQYKAPHAHSVAVDPGTGLIYAPLQDMGGRPVLRILELE